MPSAFQSEVSAAQLEQAAMLAGHVFACSPDDEIPPRGRAMSGFSARSWIVILVGLLVVALAAFTMI